MKKLLAFTVVTITILLINTTAVEPGVSTQPVLADTMTFKHLRSLLKDARPGDLSFCLGYIRNSNYNNNEIADFILTWSPDTYRKQIPSVFRSKIDRIVKILGTIDYQQLIIDVDLIKNSQLTVGEMVRLIRGTRLYKKN